LLLKYLDIQGFKSFPDKTRVTFDTGLTAVVGPNGSGKSNISDAVRWVMGEQSTKTLRGAKMEDVIFSGTKLRKSQGFAEVSLTVDNTKREFMIDSDEVVITRKYYRNGDSEYLINNGNVRLKDINEMFMDTGLGKDGYSMVGQGKIAEIVRSKSKERREIFEEAAGISKFRYRKNEAERNLANAEENLVRLRDILSELEGRIEPLKEQSEKAKKFIELSNRKKTLEVSIWNNTIEKSNQLLKDQSDRIIVANSKRDEIEQEIEGVENSIQSTFEQMQKCLISIESKRSEKENLERLMGELTSQIAVCDNDIKHNLENAQRVEAQLSDHTSSTQNIAEEITAKQEQVESINQDIALINLEIEEKQKEFLEKSSENELHSQRQRELSEKINSLLLEQSQEKMKLAQAEMNIQEATQAIKLATEEKLSKQEKLENYQKEKISADKFFGELGEKYNALQNSYDGHKIKLDNRVAKLETLKGECQASELLVKEKIQKAKLLESLENNFDGFAYSVKEVLKRAKHGAISGVHGTISQVIDVKSEYSVAIETALGSAMQNIIVENEANAKSAIRLLQQEKLGRATFLPLTSINGSTLQVQGLERYAGYVDIASNLVSYNEKFKPIIDSVLGRVVITDDIDTAVLIAQKNGYKFRIVTLDGQVVNAGGSLTGGSRNKNQGFISRKNDIAKLKEEVETLSEAHAQKLTTAKQLQAEVGQLQAQYQAVMSEMQTINEDKIRTESEIKRINHMIEQAQITQNQMQTELENSKGKLDKHNLQLSNAQEQLIKINSSVGELSAELNEIQASAQGKIEKQSEIADMLAQSRIKIIEKNKDIESINLSIGDLCKRQESNELGAKKLDEYKNELFSKNDDIIKEIENYKLEIEQRSKEIETTNQEIDEIMAQRQSLEGTTTVSRKKERDLAQEKERLASDAVRLEERHISMQKEYDEIIAKLWDEYELTKSEAKEIAIEIENVPKSTTELNSIKSKIRSLGSVNVSAIEEYQEVNQRYEFLSFQVKDAESSRNELIRLIGELTKKMQEIFFDNFNKINDNFKSIFVELFGGGSAELTLTEPDDLLESGIEIFVEPPGKIIKNLASLSGGEQAFVAIAIYFAILKVRPAPFCILDEIEAALDDVNVVKYANYLRSMSDKTQFIMITHRRGSMEAADVLYGVTMQEEGISKLLQLNVSELENSKVLEGVKI